MATIRESQGKAMDAKAVADRIYKELGTPYSEADIIEAQTWLRDVRKYGEIITTTNKKPDSTPPSTTPDTTVDTRPVTTPDTRPKTELKVSDTVPDTVPASSGPRTDTVPAVVPASSEAPDFFKNARALSDEQAIGGGTVSRLGCDVFR